MKRLRNAMLRGSDPRLAVDFGLSQAQVTFVAQGGWKIHDAQQASAQIAASRPDFLIVQVGSNDLSDVRHTDSIKVANDVLTLARHLCTISGAKGAIICHLTQRGQSSRLPSTSHVNGYNAQIQLANRYVKEVLGAGLEPQLISWPHKGMTQSMAHLLRDDGTHVNDDGQILLYKSIRGAIIRAAKEVGVYPPH